MDDRRFDDLTKLVGRRASRRSVIKAALAGAVASVFGSTTVQAALSPIKTRPQPVHPARPALRRASQRSLAQVLQQVQQRHPQVLRGSALRLQGRQRLLRADG